MREIQYPNNKNRNFLVAPTDSLAIIKYRAYHDRMCTVQSGLSGFVGQSSWLKIQASGFTGQSYAVGCILNISAYIIFLNAHIWNSN